MYVRFQSTLLSRETGRPMGMFQAATVVRSAPDFPAYLDRLIQVELDWFNDMLPIPTPFKRSCRSARKRYKSGAPQAVSWFLPEAQTCIAHGRSLATLVGEWTFPLAMITTSQPGTVLYRDDWQIVAVPFRD